MEIKKLKLYQIVEATCSDIVSEGLGISHIKSAEYKPLTGFVLGVMPGETFLAKITRVKSGHFLAVVLPVTEIPDQWIGMQNKQSQICHDTWALFNISPRRLKPECKIFTLCGSCKMLHMSYENSLEFKTKWIYTQLERNRVNHPEIKVIPSPRITKYRNHVQIHVNKHAQRGFYAPYSYTTKAFPQEGCLLFDQALVDQNFPEELRLEKCIRARIDYIQNKTGIWSLYSPDDKKGNFTYKIDYPKNSTTDVCIPNSTFFQTNTSIIPLWLEEIETMLGFSNPEFSNLRILELFSGFGFISRMLSYKHNLSVLGVDILSQNDLAKIAITNDRFTASIAEQDFRKNYIQLDLTILEKIKPETKEKIRSFQPEIIIMNPPRSGFLTQQFHYFLQNVLENMHTKSIVYSSCNGATFARDSACLADNGYALHKLTLLDFFPWTSHYEVVGLFFKKVSVTQPTSLL